MSFTMLFVIDACRRWMVRGLRWLLHRLDPPLPVTPDVARQAMLAIAINLVRAAEQTAHTGAYKRAQVLIALIRAFPHERRRVLSALVEEAVQAATD